MAHNTINLSTYKAKLLSNTYGASNSPIYFNSGVPTILGTIGGQYEPVYINNGVVTAITAGTTGQFYRGDKSWSNTLEGDLNFSNANIGIKRVGRSVNWVDGRDGAIVATTSINGYGTLASIKTTNGSWDIGAYDHNSYTDDLLFSYCTDTDHASATYNNRTTAQIIFYENGHILAALDGNASTATTWQTARTLTIGATGKSVNGSADVSWSKDEILGASTSAYFLRGDKAWSNTLVGNMTVQGNFYIGGSNSSNFISFHGLTGDNPVQDANHFFIGNRTWASSESSELVLFAGNDVGDGNSAITASGSGPDRIRLIAGAHVFQTYSSALSGAFDTVCTSSALVNVFEINTNNLTGYKRMILQENNTWLSPARLQLLRPDTTAYTDRACVGVTDGNLHIDPYPNKGLYLNFYNSGGNVYFNGSTYYINGGNYNGNAATATNASHLAYAATVDSADKMNAFGLAANVTAAKFTNNAISGIVSNDGLVLALGWSGAYCFQMACDDQSNNFSIRSCSNGTWNAWTRVVTNSGTWDISVTGSSGSCTGNAATATTATNLNGGTVTATSITANNNIGIYNNGSAGGSNKGISLYNGTGNVLSYGILFELTSSLGQHGVCNSDWATYFTMAGATNRGWIFRHTSIGNIASINGEGCISLGYRTGTNISAHRVCLIPPYHTGGPWYIDAYDPNTSYAYCDFIYNTTHVFQIRHDGHVWASAGVHNAVWNDLAECRRSAGHEAGRAIEPNGTYTTKRLQAGVRIISDTWGFILGDDEDNDKAPVAISGRVLAYPYRDISAYNIGDAVCSAPNGTIDIMTREEIMLYPDRIIGIVNEIPDYDIWEPSKKADRIIYINNRIWIDIK